MSTNGMTLHTMRSASDHFGSGIIKTVILPNEEMNRLAVEAEELKQYLSAQKRIYEDSITAYDKDRLIREQEYKLKNSEL